jgi:DNA repair exonuclease SbcCD ATPase subunit
MAERRVKYIIEFDTKTGQSQIQGLDGKIIATANSAKQLTKEINNLKGGEDGKGGMEGLTKSTGGASAAALELGRVISDAPYGIRGMANNVSQLASNILFMSQQVDKSTGRTIGFMGALRGIGSALMGPLGVLLAIQAVIAAIDYFAGSTSKAKEEVDELNSSLGQAYQKFTLVKEVAMSVYDDVFVEMPSSAAGLKVLRNEFSELDKKLKQLEDTGKDTPEKIGELVNKYQELLQVRMNIEKSENKIKKLREEEPEGYNALISLEQKRLLGLYTTKANLEELFEVEKKSTTTREKTIKEFKKNLLDLSSELARYRQTEIQNIDVSEEERLKLEYDASKKAVELKRQEFDQKEQLRLADKIKEINAAKISQDKKDALIKDAENKFREAQVQANIDMRSVMLQADIAYYAELAALRREDTERVKEETRDLIESLREMNFNYQEYVHAENILRQTNELDRIEAEKQANIALTDLKVQNLQKDLEQTNITEAEKQDIRNKIEALRQDQRLYDIEMEQKSAQAKMAIANQVANAIIAIAGEGSGLAKGVAIAQTIWNTKQGVMAALGSAPYGPWNIAQAAAVAAMGVKNVADIIATKAPNEKSSGGAGAGGGASTSTFTPDFNIVGASGQNQLASAVAGQLGEPTRAYVVYDDIQTAGQIEANAVQSAGI